MYKNHYLKNIAPPELHFSRSDISGEVQEPGMHELGTSTAMCCCKGLSHRLCVVVCIDTCMDML